MTKIRQSPRVHARSIYAPRQYRGLVTADCGVEVLKWRTRMPTNPNIDCRDCLESVFSDGSNRKMVSIGLLLQSMIHMSVLENCRNAENGFESLKESDRKIITIALLQQAIICFCEAHKKGSSFDVNSYSTELRAAYKRMFQIRNKVGAHRDQSYIVRNWPRDPDTMWGSILMQMFFSSATTYLGDLGKDVSALQSLLWSHEQTIDGLGKPSGS